MTEAKFNLKKPLTNEMIASLGAKLGATLGEDRQPRCMGIRIYYVDKFGVLMSSGLFSKGFSPEDWDDDK